MAFFWETDCAAPDVPVDDALESSLESAQERAPFGALDGAPLYSSDSLIDQLSAEPAVDDDEPEFRALYQTLLGSASDGANCRLALTLAEEESGTEKDLHPGADDGAMQLPCVPSLLGKYRLEACIGRGTYGTVYRARHVHLDQLFAVKVLNADRFGGTDAVGRFVDEMRAAGTLIHPNVIRATDAGRDGGWHYLVMEYVEGVDAGRLLRAAGRLPLADACEIVRQAALGLAFAHRQSLVHRDVKPSNILVGVDGQIKLLDLGLALRRDAAFQRGGQPQPPLGTAEYMPPEQWVRASEVDARADLYSLGCTLYKLVTGRSPFASSTLAGASLAERHRREQPVPLRTHRTDAPRWLDRLAAKLLAKSPAARPASADVVARALEKERRFANLPQLLAQVVEGEDSQTLAIRANRARGRVVAGGLLSRRSLLAGGAAASASALWFSLRGAPRLTRGTWRPLAPAEPPLLLALDADAAPRWRFDPENQLGEMASQLPMLLQFGRPVAGPWQFEVELWQEEWRADVGLFFQWRTGGLDESWRMRCQSVQLQPWPADARVPQLLWSEWKIQPSADGERAINVPWAVVPVAISPDNQPQRLSVAVGRRGFPQVRWNGVTLDENAWTASTEGRRQQTLAPDLVTSGCLGPLGLIHSGGVTQFRQPRLAYMET